MVVEIDVSSRIIARDTESTVGQGIQHGVGAQPRRPRSLSQVDYYTSRDHSTATSVACSTDWKERCTEERMGALLEIKRCKADALEAAGIVSSIREDLVEAQGTSAAFKKSSTRSHNAHETRRDEVEAAHQEIQEMQQQTMHGHDSHLGSGRNHASTHAGVASGVH